MKNIIKILQLDEVKPVILAIFLFFIPRMIAKYDYLTIAKNAIPFDVQYEIHTYLLGMSYDIHKIYWENEYLVFSGVANLFILFYFSFIFMFYTYKNYRQYKSKINLLRQSIWNMVKVCFFGSIIITFFSIITPQRKYAPLFTPVDKFSHTIENYYIVTGLFNIKISKIKFNKNAPLANQPFLKSL